MTPDAGILLHVDGFHGFDIGPSDFSLSIKGSDGRVEDISCGVKDSIIYFLDLDANHTLMSYLVDGNFKLVLNVENLPYHKDRNFVFKFGNETKGAWETAQRYLGDHPNFWNLWGGDMY